MSKCGETGCKSVGEPLDQPRRLGAAIVAYGSRGSQLREVMRALSGAGGVDYLVVVDNGTRYDLQAEIRDIADRLDTHLVQPGRNLGSAGGFALAITTAKRVGAGGHLLLLDDDNAPEQQAFRKLRQEMAETPNGVFLMNRSSRREIEFAISSRSDITHAPNTFAGFSFRRAISRRLPRCPSSPETGGRRLEAEFAPYGGLVAPVDVLNAVAPPRQEYFVYADDHEFTTRLAKEFGPIMIVEGAILNDLEASGNARRGLIMGPADLSTDDTRAYLSVRNRIHLEVGQLRKSRPEFAINGLIVSTLWLAGLAWQLCVENATVDSIIERIRVLSRGVRNGLAGDLKIE